MRARPLALIIAGLLASTSAIGIALYHSQQQRPEEARPEAGTGLELNADDTAALEASSGEALDPLQVDESLLYEVQAFDTAHGEWHVSMPDLALPTLQPLSGDKTLRLASVDTGHVQAGSVTGSSNGSPGFTNSLQTRTLSAGLSPGFGGGGGGGRSAGRNSNPETGTDAVDQPTGKSDEHHPPKSPETPTNSETPETPKAPETPTTPETPTVPETPTTPETPTIPQTPSVPDEPPFIPETGTPGSGVETPPVSVPEPGTLGLIGVGLVGLLLGRRKRAQRS